MKEAIQTFKAVSFETRKELDIHERVALMNATLNLKLAIEKRMKLEAADVYKAARKSTDRLATYRVEQRVIKLVENEWSERIDSEIMADLLWFDKSVMIDIVNYVLKQIGGIHIEGVDHLAVRGSNEIRIITARSY